MKEYTIDERKLVFGNGNTLEFDFAIMKVIDQNERIYVMLDVFGDNFYNQNIFAVSGSGELLWQIEKSNELDSIGHCPFIDFEITESLLISWNWCGFRFRVDINNGKIVDSTFTK
ncbi:MAG: hypothetical protein JWR02_2738 [Mucilaginibacter sp.]|nr:hypothetical protein [Mucilaginibacter sp.]